MTDSHCHLDFCAEPEAAADPGLTLIATVGTTVERSRQALTLAERFSNVYAVVGIHPNESYLAQDGAVREAIESLAGHPRVVGIGETGFDSYWDKVPMEVQRESFYWHADLASRRDKPLVLHVRDKKAEDRSAAEAALRLREVGYGKGILHCFNGQAELLQAGSQLGWYVSFAGNLTYKNAHALHATARALPADRLLVETDSPFLTPHPKRGQPNRPANVRHVIEFLAALRGEKLDYVEAYTDANAARVYNLM